MTERTLTDADIKAIGEAVSEALIKSLSSEKTASSIMNQWESWMDKKIGRGVRKIAVTVILFILAIAATKFDLWSKVIPK